MTERQNFEKPKLNVEVREKQIPGRIENVCNDFFALETAKNDDALAKVKQDAQTLSDEIVQLTESVLNEDSQRNVQQLEHAGDILVSLLGYVEMIEQKIIDIKQAVEAVQKNYQRYLQKQ